MGLSTSWFHKFFTPSIPPYTIAKAVIAAIDEQESRTIFLPFYTHFVRWVTVLPSYIRDLFQWVSTLSRKFAAAKFIDEMDRGRKMSGADYAMEGFIKISGRRPEEGRLDLGQQEDCNGHAKTE